MKKLTVIFICMLLAFSLVACGSVSESGNDSENNSGLSNQVPGNNSKPDNSSSDTDKTEKKILVVYYSATGSAEKAANIIASAADSDIFELTPVNEYSSEDLRWTDQNRRVVREHDDLSQRDVELVKNSVDNWNEYLRGFMIDNVFPSESLGDIRFNVCVPESYDGSRPYALYFTLPGYEGLYFQGVAQNLKSEEFGFESQKYNSEMIVVAPQLSDWRENSANQTIALVEYFMKNYNIDYNKVCSNGSFGGGGLFAYDTDIMSWLFDN